uniref:Olfactory receptor family 51 subfamily Q member 1 n=1 Tax=Spermophilus dauricus TaxID=99837 RepID=A0A8C9P0P0_SPEDA
NSENSNSSLGFLPTTFILVGIPGLEAEHFWISIPFCLMYIIIFLGNGTILHVIRTDPSLRQPMYLFLSMLALTDLGLTLTTLPTVMQLFWFNLQKIRFEACFAQFFFLHGFSFMESSVFLAMSFDRYVAICRPLHYASILTREVICRIGSAIICRCVLAVLPSLFLLKRLPFCRSHLLSHSYCLHQDMIHLVCADTRVNAWYGFALVLLIIVMDPLLIVLSYVLILKNVLSTATRTERFRALNNCLSHFLAVLVLYVPMVGVSMTQRFAKHASPLVHVIMANIYLLAPPVMNPIIYSAKTKQIRQGITRLLFQRKMH